MISYIPQPENSRLCGQTCVAMAAGVSLEHSIKVFGKRGGTYTKDVISALRYFGLRVTQTRLKRIEEELPDTCIIKVCWSKGSHWVLYNRGQVYDPAFGMYHYSKEIFSSLGPGGRATSYLKIEKTNTGFPCSLE